MDILGKIGSIAKSVTEKTADSIEINRINGDIHTEKYKIEMLKQQIGDYYWAKFAVGEHLDMEAMVMCDKIVMCMDNIRNFQTEIRSVKENRDIEDIKQEDEKPLGGIRFCKTCGDVIEEGKNFCGECGTHI